MKDLKAEGLAEVFAPQLTVCLWSSCSIFLCLAFLISKRRITICLNGLVAELCCVAVVHRL